MLVDVTEEMIREQLDRVLNSAQFKSSRRCRSFLEYVVTQAASGHLEPLKERTIGIEVFHRDPDYDTNHDPVVRGAASEIRKRLAQYYQAPGNDNQLRIDLSAGSYLPEFHSPADQPIRSITPAPTVAPAIPVVEIEPEPFLKVRPGRRISRRWLIGSSALAALAILVIAVLSPYSKYRASIVDQFWAPVLNNPGPILLCVGQPTVFNLVGSLNSQVLEGAQIAAPAEKAHRKLTVDLTQIIPNSDRYLALGDAMCLSSLAVFLAQRNHEYHIRGGGLTSFADLRENTTVLIGGFTNDWTMRLTAQLRFTFKRNADGATIYVNDRLNPGARQWQLTNAWPDWNMPQDYAIVTRVFDPNTGKVVVSAAGITQYGTAAAGEFLTDPKYLKQALGHAPKDWQQKNLEVVLSTRVIGKTAGPPQVLATQFQ